MSRKSLPLGVMAMILIVALATIGVAYGLWSETLYINGTVHTGTVDVGFSGPIVKEWVEVSGGNPYWWGPKLDYTECAAVIVNQGTDKETLQITVKEAYPSYHCMVKFDVSNLGTVPVHISLPEGQAPEWVKVRACYPNWEQVHPRESVWASILIHFINKDEVMQDADYQFSFVINALQWNEAPAPEELTTLDSSCSE